MAKARKLKVYRTPIGFHDAYVAAPSQKAALAAWGSDVDLFARGVAEVVDDDALTREPLADPGTIVRRSRGSADEHLAALPPDPPPRPRPAEVEEDEPDGAADDGPAPRARRTVRASRRPAASRAAAEAPPARQARTRPVPPRPSKSEKAPKHEPSPKSKPRPSRRRLDEAERALDELVARQRDEAAKLREEERAATTRRREADRRHERDRAAAEDRVEAARRAYGEALSRR